LQLPVPAGSWILRLLAAWVCAMPSCLTCRAVACLVGFLACLDACLLPRCTARFAACRITLPAGLRFAALLVLCRITHWFCRSANARLRLLWFNTSIWFLPCRLPVFCLRFTIVGFALRRGSANAMVHLVSALPPPALPFRFCLFRCTFAVSFLPAAVAVLRVPAV